MTDLPYHTDLGNLRDVMRHTAAFIGAQRFKA